MRIKTLEIAGFKSFVDRTVIQFEPGITGIVGPNGCGKSNVVDAILWVMGEQSAKHLRGESMEDVIFNGSDKRPPMGMASVFLTFDNADGRAPAQYANYTEITVGRRLYRSGESEYFINKTPCRLKDIVDLFLGTGIGTKAYSIIEQGKIGQIVSSKPEHRRAFIEEAAGISKFKSRKEAALRQMDSTKANLLRLSDIMSELSRQINSLERQAKKAEKYKSLFEELKGIDLAVASRRISRLSDEISGAEKTLGELGSDEAGRSRSLAQAENEIEEGKLGLQEIEQRLSDNQERLYQVTNQVRMLETDVAYKHKTITDTTARIQAAATEIDELNVRLERVKQELERANGDRVEADMSLATAREEVERCNTDYSAVEGDYRQLAAQLEDRQQELMECVQRMTRSQTSIERFEQREIDLKGYLAKNQTEIDEIDKKTEKLHSDISRITDELSGLQQMRLEIGEGLEESQSALRLQEEESQRVEQTSSALRHELGVKQQRLLSLEELQRNFEGYQQGVKSILKHREQGGLDGVHGTISQMMEASPEYEVAVSAVLGEKLQYLVVESQEAGVGGVHYLRQASAGRGTFIPISLPHQAASKASLSSTGEGVIGSLFDHVRFQDEFRHIGRYLLGDVLLVEDLSVALRLWSSQARRQTLVTQGGDVLDAAGVVSGGHGEDNATLFLARKREISQLNEAVTRLKTELAVHEERAKKIKERIFQLKQSVDHLSQSRHAEDIRVIHQENNLNHLRQELERHQRERDRLTMAVANYADDLNRLQSERVQSDESGREAEGRKIAVEAEVGGMKQREGELRSRLAEVSHTLTGWKMKLASCEEKSQSLDKEIDQTLGMIEETRVTIAKRHDDVTGGTDMIEGLRTEIESEKRALQEAIAQADLLKEQQTGIKNDYENEAEKMRQEELALRELRKTCEQTRAHIHEAEMKHVQLSEKRDYLKKEILERYRLELSDEEDHYALQEGVALEEAQRQVVEMRAKLDKLGSVNLDAIGEYEELKNRHDFLSRQYDDLTNSLDSLNRAIQKINRTSRQRFKETFEAVNERFQKLFPRLFRGGKASLVLTNEEDLLESGVEIIAQPPGKKLQSVTLLSGGEKALTAVAMIFSIFLIKPSPFCLLDEVDAPLDDANIDRFNEIIREMTSRSQFIVITHNKRTMELADVLYGVTMEEAGASKLVSVRLEEHKKEETQAA